ncbi:MAG: DNA recombination protein RmuC [Candidatus Omnitrophica bacterium]|nr:DNA recombination protein RmuC [Candidatus Omnitrophota bacterium]
MIIILIITVVALLIFNIINSSKIKGDKQGLLMLNQQIGQFTAQMNTQLNTITEQVNQRLKENTDVLQQSNKSVSERLDRAAAVIGPLQNRLGELQEASKRIYEVGRDVSRLENLLKAPKFRGEIGEFSLANLLGQILPKKHFTLQYSFKNSAQVDAVIRLGEKLVPVDSKFPLENFKKMLEENKEDVRKRLEKEFARDVRKHIDTIANKYILPDEGTYDFALLYIPAENVYYETIIKTDICSYAVSKKIIPVSPNSFYAYLMVIVLGLRGMEIDKNTKKIISNLGRLNQDLAKFSEDFVLVGKHLFNTKKKYEDAEKNLSRFNDKLISVSQEKKEVELFNE